MYNKAAAVYGDRLVYFLLLPFSISYVCDTTDVSLYMPLDGCFLVRVRGVLGRDWLPCGTWAGRKGDIISAKRVGDGWKGRK